MELGGNPRLELPLPFDDFVDPCARDSVLFRQLECWVAFAELPLNLAIALS